MNAQDLAALLTGREYRKEITPAEEAAAKAAGLVVVFGASDDLMEFRGAIHDEVGCYNGGTAHVTPDGLLQSECEDERCPYAKRLAKNAATVDAIFDQDGFTFVFETEIPHHTFEIVEGEDRYCRGVVFALADAKPRMPA